MKIFLNRLKRLIISGACITVVIQTLKMWELKRKEPRLLERARQVIRPAGTLRIKTFSFRTGQGLFEEVSPDRRLLEWTVDLYRSQIIDKKPGSKARAYNE